MRPLTAALVLAAGLAIGAGWDAWASQASTGPARIRITDREVSFSSVDIGRRGRSVGDMQIWSTLLFNQRITRRPIGHTEFLCTYTRGISRSCRGTVFLPRGKLVVGGAVRFRQFYELAILGGTGLYDNARGTLVVTRATRSPRRHVLVFRLVG